MIFFCARNRCAARFRNACLLSGRGGVSVRCGASVSEPRSVFVSSRGEVGLCGINVDGLFGFFFGYLSNLWCVGCDSIFCPCTGCMHQQPCRLLNTVDVPLPNAAVDWQWEDTVIDPLPDAAVDWKIPSMTHHPTQQLTGSGKMPSMTHHPTQQLIGRGTALGDGTLTVSSYCAALL